MKYDSHCIVCKRPAMAPKGNLNAKRVTLCQRKECRHKRKIELQRERRRQKELFDKSELQALTLCGDEDRTKAAPSTVGPSRGKASTAGNSQASDARPSREQSRRPAKSKPRHKRHISLRAKGKSRRGVHEHIL